MIRVTVDSIRVNLLTQSRMVMLREVAVYAKSQGFVRLDWQALKWNAEAINFYKNLGAETDDENLDFRVRGAAFQNLSEGI